MIGAWLRSRKPDPARMQGHALTLKIISITILFVMFMTPGFSFLLCLVPTLFTLTRSFFFLR